MLGGSASLDDGNNANEDRMRKQFMQGLGAKKVRQQLSSAFQNKTLEEHSTTKLVEAVERAAWVVETGEREEGIPITSDWGEIFVEGAKEHKKIGRASCRERV